MFSPIKTLLAITAALLATQCSVYDEGNTTDPEGKKGSLSLTLTTDTDVSKGSYETEGNSRASSTSRPLQALENVTSDNFSFKIISSDGQTVRSWNSFADFDPTVEYAPGSYKAVAAYGDKSDEGFDKPALSGERSFTIYEGETTPVHVTARVKSSIVRVEFTQEVRNYFKDFRTTLSTSVGKKHEFGLAEDRSLYVTPGVVHVTAEFTFPSGEKGSVDVADFDAVEATLHRLVFDTDGTGSGSDRQDLTLTLRFDDTLNNKEVVIDLQEEFGYAPLPTVTTSGFRGGVSIAYYEHNANLDRDPVAFYIGARGGMKDVVLKVTTHRGAMTVYNLMDKNDLAELESKYNFVPEAIAEGSKYGRVNLTPWLQSLSVLPGSADGEVTTFEISVEDRFGQTTDPSLAWNNVCAVALYSEKSKLISGYKDGLVPATYFDMTLLTTIDNLLQNPERLTLYTQNEALAEVELPFRVLTRSTGTNGYPYSYILRAQTPEMLTAFEVRGVIDNKKDCGKLTLTVEESDDPKEKQ